MSALSLAVLIPLAMSRAAEIDAVMPLIADQSMFSPAFLLATDGCVSSSIVAQGEVGTISLEA